MPCLGKEMRVLVIEGDQKVLKDITFCLRVRYPDVVVVSAVQGRKGIDLLESEAPDLCLLDDSSPDGDILDLISNIREFSDIPMIVMANNRGDLDRSKILEAGADEYVNKPFSPIELLAVVRALLRRTKGLDLKAEETFAVDNRLTVNFSTHEVTLNGKTVKLIPTEYKMLAKLVRNEGRVVTTHTLLETVWVRNMLPIPAI